MSLLLKLLVTAGLIALVAFKLDLGVAVEHIMRAGAAACAFGVAANLAQSAVLALRWHLILAESGLRPVFRATLKIVLIGTFFNQCLPTSLGGDAVRIALLHRDGVSLKNAANAVVVDRLSGIAALVLLLLMGLPSLIAWAPGSAFLFGSCAVTALFCGTLAAYFMGDWIIALVPPVARLRLAQNVAAASAYARRIAWASPSSPAVALLAILVQLSTVGIVAGLALFMHVSISPLRAVVLVPPIVAAALLPISFGGWGTREIAMAAGLGLAGVPTGTAVAISVLLGLLLLLSSIPGGIVWLLDRSRFSSKHSRTDADSIAPYGTAAGTDSVRIGPAARDYRRP